MYPCDISDHEAFIEEAAPGRKGILTADIIKNYSKTVCRMIEVV
jgi:hypothetical protein